MRPGSRDTSRVATAILAHEPCLASLTARTALNDLCCPPHPTIRVHPALSLSLPHTHL